MADDPTTEPAADDPHVARSRAALARAIELLGTQTALAELIGGATKTAHVYYWLNKGRIPAQHCPTIERATHGEVRCEDLCPDVDWAVLRIPMPADAA